MNEFMIKGWCPSYTKPALAKDGFFLRISPDKGYLSLKKPLLYVTYQFVLVMD